jgi:oligoribonuclease (3'-5' exoribonuclease)
MNVILLVDKAYEETRLMRDYDVATVEEIAQQWPPDLVEAAI